jgi:hypothetical protein
MNKGKSYFVLKPEEKEHSGDLDVDERIILR